MMVVINGKNTTRGSRKVCGRRMRVRAHDSKCMKVSGIVRIRCEVGIQRRQSKRPKDNYCLGPSDVRKLFCFSGNNLEHL